MTDDLKINEELLQQAINGLNVSGDRGSDTLDQLRKIGRDSLLYRTRKAGQPWSKTRKQLEQIRKAASDLVEIMGGAGDLEGLKRVMSESPGLAIAAFRFAELTNPERQKHFPLDDVKTRNRLKSFLRDLQTFIDAADSGLKNVSQRIDSVRGGPRHKADWALEETSWHVLRLYFEVTNRRPGVSRTEGAPRSGPAVRFLDTCLRAYGWDTDSSTAANMIDKLNKDRKAPWNTTSENQI